MAVDGGDGIVGVAGGTDGLGGWIPLGAVVFSGSVAQAATSKLSVTKVPTIAKRDESRNFITLFGIFRDFMSLYLDNFAGLILLRDVPPGTLDYFLQCIHVLLHNLFRAQIDEKCGTQPQHRCIIKCTDDRDDCPGDKVYR